MGLGLVDGPVTGGEFRGGDWQFVQSPIDGNSATNISLAPTIHNTYTPLSFPTVKVPLGQAHIHHNLLCDN